MATIPTVCGRATGRLSTNARVPDFGDARQVPCPGRIQPETEASTLQISSTVGGSPTSVEDLATNLLAGAYLAPRQGNIDPHAETVLIQNNGTRLTILKTLQQEVELEGKKFPTVRSIIYLNVSNSPATIEAQRASINGADSVQLAAGSLSIMTSKPVTTGTPAVEFALITLV